LLLRQIIRSILTFILALLLTPVASALTVIDQSQSIGGSGFCRINSTDLCGQSFQQSQSNISGAGIFLNPYYVGTDNITISIYQTYSTNPSGLIATGTSGVVNQNSGWVDVSWSPVATTPFSEYYIVLSSNNGQLVASGITGNNYSLGAALAYGYDESHYGSWDLAFRTYYDDAYVAPGVVAPVPEPQTYAMLLAGLGLIGFTTRRKKHNFIA